MSFALSVDKYVRERKGDLSEFQKAIILELFVSVILDTPVDTGRLRGNWIISADEPDLNIVEIQDPDGSITITNVQNFVSDLNVLKNYEVYLANSLPYAARIEFDGWSHTKAPEGMVRKNIARVQANLRAA